MGPRTATGVPTKGKSLGKHIKHKTPKKPIPTTDRLKRLFTSLCAQIEGAHFGNAIKTCDKILKIEPKDQDATQAKLFLLLQTDQYPAALDLIGDQEDQVFEKVYSLYRVHQEEEVADVLKVIKQEKGEDDRGITHLEAQLRYRQGSYRAAFDLYNELLDTAEPDTEEHSDVLTNLEASQKHLDFINTGYLHALDALPNSLTSTLESAPPPPQPHVPSIFTSLITTASDEQQKPAKPVERKVRAKRVPTGVTPGVTPPPDPERWLKKTERSTFHTSHKRRKGGGGATQGLVESAPSVVSAGGGKGKGKKKR